MASLNHGRLKENRLTYFPDPIRVVLCSYEAPGQYEEEFTSRIHPQFDAMNSDHNELISPVSV